MNVHKSLYKSSIFYLSLLSSVVLVDSSVSIFCNYFLQRCATLTETTRTGPAKVILIHSHINAHCHTRVCSKLPDASPITSSLTTIYVFDGFPLCLRELCCDGEWQLSWLKGQGFAVEDGKVTVKSNVWKPYCMRLGSLSLPWKMTTYVFVPLRDHCNWMFSFLY